MNHSKSVLYTLRCMFREDPRASTVDISMVGPAINCYRVQHVTKTCQSFASFLMRALSCAGFAADGGNANLRYDLSDELMLGLEDASNVRLLLSANSSLQGEGSADSSVLASWNSAHTPVASSCVGYASNDTLADGNAEDDDLESADSSSFSCTTSTSSSCNEAEENADSFMAEAQFATALAQAIQANGLASASPAQTDQLPILHNQRQRLCAMDPSSIPSHINNWQPLPVLPQHRHRQRKKRRHRNRNTSAPRRSTSPYSTDSNYGALPSKFVYLHADQHRQMKN